MLNSNYLFEHIQTVHGKKYSILSVYTMYRTGKCLDCTRGQRDPPSGSHARVWTTDVFFSRHHIDSDGSGSLKVIDLDRKTLRDRDLTIRQYTLPEGYLLVKFKLTVNDRADRSKQYSDNRYMVCARSKISIPVSGVSRLTYRFRTAISVFVARERRRSARGYRRRSGPTGEQLRPGDSRRVVVGESERTGKSARRRAVYVELRRTGGPGKLSNVHDVE